MCFVNGLSVRSGDHLVESVFLGMALSDSAGGFATTVVSYRFARPWKLCSYVATRITEKPYRAASATAAWQDEQVATTWLG